MAATKSGVFITVPKYVAITPGPLPKIRPLIASVAGNRSTNGTHTLAAAMSPTSSSGYASSSGGTDEGSTTPRGKKRRLDHLTWDEKIQRKKLKNRVAAQTSRDRKKARMEEMEHELKDLTEATEILQNKCDSLQSINNSLLEKNQKLDTEVEILRQQLKELQQSQKQQEKEKSRQESNVPVATCAGSGIISTGLTVDTRAAEAQRDIGFTLADCGALPSLQDMLLLDDEDVVADFDAGKLEELAESLLADIAADMEAGDRTCNEAATETAGRPERLPRPVVGAAAELLESGEHRGGGCVNTIPTLHPALIVAANTIPQHNLQSQRDETMPSIKPLAIKPTTTMTTNTTEPVPFTFRATSTPDTVYGTYDARTNSITIVMDDGSVPVGEAVEEIYCEGEAPPLGDDEIEMPPTSPSQVHVNVDCCSDDEDNLDFEPIAKFLRPKRRPVSPLARSPALSLHSATSDHGYESIMGSPTSTATERFEAAIDDFAWNSSFNELFPTLL